MNISGKIIEIFDIQKVTDTFQKREFVVEYVENPSYPEYIKFELIQERCSLLDPFNVGDEISVEFNLKGRKWEDKNGIIKYFNTLQAWRLEEKVGTPVASPQPPPINEEPDSPASGQEEDNLPF